MATPHCNFTEKDLDAWVAETLRQWAEDPASIPANGEASIADLGGKNSVPGLRLRLRLRREEGRYSLEAPWLGFFLVRKIDGKMRNRKIGDRAVYSVEMAREAAKEESRDLSKGVDRVEIRRKEAETTKALSLTYRQALEEVLEDDDLAPNTVKKYRLSLTTTFAKVADRPLVEFTPALASEIFKARSTVSPSRADQDFRVLRLVWNSARERHLDPEGNYLLGPNPVPLALNKRRATGQGKAQKAKWNLVPRRETLIPLELTPDWLSALDTIREESPSSSVTRRTCELMEALTVSGLRWNELAKLEWPAVDFNLGKLTIPAPLSKNKRPLIKPLTRRLRVVLERRWQERKNFPATALIWPGQDGQKPISDPRFVLKVIKERTGLEITPHDLRRGWASAALCAGIPQEAIKRLMNHLSHASEDVTAGYQILDLNTLRNFAQQVEDHLLSVADPKTEPNATEAMLSALLGEMDEAEKRRLLFELSRQRVERAA